jgi:hypothetical protein
MGQHELAQVAYVAYGKATEFKNFRGEPMPSYADLPEKIKEAWVAAANAVNEETKFLKPMFPTFDALRAFVAEQKSMFAPSLTWDKTKNEMATPEGLDFQRAQQATKYAQIFYMMVVSNGAELSLNIDSIVIFRETGESVPRPRKYRNAEEIEFSEKAEKEFLERLAYNQSD